MGIFSKLLKREDPLVTTPPITVVSTKKVKSAPKRAPAKKAPAKKPARKQVAHKDYLLYQSGARYFFSKDKRPAASKGWKRVYAISTGYEKRVTKTGLPVLAKKGSKPAAKKPAAKPAAKKAPAKRKTLPYDYKGDVHEVVDLEGIGPTMEKKLHAAKIINTQQLLFTGDRRLANVTGAPAKTIQNWKHMSQLVKLNGVGPQFAELMVRAGVAGIDGLKTMTPAAGVKQIKEYEAGLKTKVTGSGIGPKRMADFIKQAKAARKVPIDLKKIDVIGLESRQAIADKRGKN